jgi:hypothetical protein
MGISFLARAGEIAGLDQVYVDFLRAEASNSYQAADSTVDPKFRAGNLNPFLVGYIEMPSGELEFETSCANDPLIREHFFVDVAKTKIRFFIHPDSEHLYKPLIEKYGYTGFYQAVATSSARTVLAWDPTRPETKPLFLKLSLAQKQDGMGRIVPDWEIRRGVRITETVDQDIKAGRISTDKVSLIPEVAGASVKSSAQMKHFVDAIQGDVSQHGFILRDASFIETHQKSLVVPMFWLFSKGSKDESPIVTQWERSRYFTKNRRKNLASFQQFLANRFFTPFIRQNLPLMLSQGIVPQIHGQNVVLVLNRETGEIETILHRDIGSMKVDYRLRWIKNLPIGSLASPKADKDFGLSWGAEEIEKYHLSYLHDWIFQSTYLADLRASFPDFNPDVTRELVRKILALEVDRLLGTSREIRSSKSKILEYIGRNPPRYESIYIKGDSFMNKARVLDLIVDRELAHQTIDLPQAWRVSFNAKFARELATLSYVWSCVPNSPDW